MRYGRPVEKARFNASVRDLVAFVLRTGDLGGRGAGWSSLWRATEGTRGHQQIQRSRPNGYEKELSISHRIETAELALEISGRIDGFWTAAGAPWIEEIKTTFGPPQPGGDMLHWAQGKFYAAMHAAQNQCQEVGLQLTYLQLDSQEVVELRRTFSRDELLSFFQKVTAEYILWLTELQRWRQARDASIAKLSFPFSSYRPGQRQFAVAVYRAISHHKKLFAEAPTGIGKTMAALFPTIKALGEGKVQKFFYLTAKGSGQTIAEKALRSLREAGLKLRALTLTAREKVCRQSEIGCDISTCPLALGYYDRVKPALRDLLGLEEINRPAVEAVAARHQVCPFALAQDATSWSDAVICDYNYAFDPGACLRDYFSDASGDVFLVDEAHNLLDRARQMFSAELSESELRVTAAALMDCAPECAKAIQTISRKFAKWRRALAPTWAANESAVALLPEEPHALVPALKKFLRRADVWLAQNHMPALRPIMAEGYFQAAAFLRVLQSFDHRYAAVLERDGKHARLHLFCVDPSAQLRHAWQRASAALLFSGTLTPVEFFREALGGESRDDLLRIPSPFPASNLAVLLASGISTEFKERDQSINAVAEAVGAVVQAKTGHYLVFFPSFAYLERVAAHFQKLFPTVPLLAQRSRMDDAARAEFLDAFERSGSRVGFAVMGGIFGEGIEFRNEKLAGSIIVGVGLPQLCWQRDLIRAYFEQQAQATLDEASVRPAGFDCAYLFPGMNRVLQAAGRVIRSEKDRGIVLLVDRRFGETRYLRLFPPHWSVRPGMNRPDQIASAAREFWDSETAAPAEKLGLSNETT